ncbi:MULTISPECIES: hypothetical protein [unclassified Lactococcus]|uniref:hypothetical protein n=1 Tax=unclassified Lactococcus TaxID=2643510 RepID=UPI001297EA5A|nr:MULTISPECIES: hypothetical protein [unclassified Lactococcus]MQW22278.1 hypothetical protein [Lactococcus sp. dk101]
MKINLFGLGIFMIVLGILVLLLGGKIAGAYIYTIILVVYGIGLVVKYKGKK